MKRWEFERAVLGSELAAPARLILLALAVLADWPGGQIPAKFSPSLSTLEVMTGLSRRALMNHLNSVERSAGRQDGWVVRSRPTKEKARAEKERTRYRLVVPARARGALELGQEMPLSRAGDALARAPHALGLGHDVPSARAPRAHKPDHFQTYSQPAQPPTPNGPEQIVIDATGAAPDEAAAVAKRVANERQPRSLPGLLRRMATDGDLTQLLTEHRAAARKEKVAQALEAARRGPECEHRVPGGAALHPSTREPICPQCRTAAKRNGLKVVSA